MKKQNNKKIKKPALLKTKMKRFSRKQQRPHSLLDVLESGSKIIFFFSAVFAIALFYFEYQHQKFDVETGSLNSSRIAWLTLAQYQGQPYGGGRRHAMRILIDEEHILDYVDLSNAPLREIDMSGAKMRFANFSGSDLAYGDLSNADLLYTNFSLDPAKKQTSLYKANFTNSAVTGSDFAGADLRHANFKNAKWGNVVLCGADLRGAKFIDPAELAENNFSASNADTNFDLIKYQEQIQLESLDLTQADLDLACPEQKLPSACGDKNTMLPEKLNVRICDANDISRFKKVHGRSYLSYISTKTKLNALPLDSISRHVEEMSEENLTNNASKIF